MIIELTDICSGPAQTVEFASPHFALICNCRILVHSSGFYGILECASKHQVFATCDSCTPAYLSTEARDRAYIRRIGRRRGLGY